MCILQKTLGNGNLPSHRQGIRNSCRLRYDTYNKDAFQSRRLQVGVHMAVGDDLKKAPSHAREEVTRW